MDNGAIYIYFWMSVSIRNCSTQAQLQLSRVWEAVYSTCSGWLVGRYVIRCRFSIQFWKGDDSTWRSNHKQFNFFVTGVRNVLYGSKITHLTLRELEFRYKAEIKNRESDKQNIRILSNKKNLTGFRNFFLDLKLHIWSYMSYNSGTVLKIRTFILKRLLFRVKK